MTMENERSIRILFFGTPDFALPTLDALARNGYAVVGAVTRPDERVGRKQILTPPPVKVEAGRHGIPVFQPEKLDARDFAADKIPRADLFVVAAYGKIIPKDILDMPRLGCLNIHPSLLPRWRGPAPIQYAILHGDAETGITIMKMDEEVDHGPIVAQRKISVADQKIAYPELHDRLAELGAALLTETLPRFIRGEIAGAPQDHARATYSKMLTRGDGRIDWKKSAEEIERMVRALHPWPGTWTTWKNATQLIRVRIAAATTTEDMPLSSAPGLVWRDAARPLLIASANGSLAVQKLGVEGKEILDAETFIHGYPRIIGAVLE